MRIVTAEEMRSLDEQTIKQLGIPGVVLMENAGLQVVQGIKEVLGSLSGKRVLVLAGKGNNGGDGFVVARHLINQGADVKVLLLANAEDIRGDAKTNLDVLQRMGQKVYSVVNANSLNIVRIAIMYTDLIVDAIYGTGFQGRVNEHIGKIIELINESHKPVIAVDIPSGVEADTGKVHDSAVKANRTVTFALPKLGLVLEPGATFTGQLTVADISIPQAYLAESAVKRYLLTPELIRAELPSRQPESHKGDFGRILVVGGSEGLTGAAALASEGALRAGAGLVTLGIPRSLHGIMEAKLTEVMTLPLPETEAKSLSLEASDEIKGFLSAMNALAIGPGISRHASTIKLVQQLITEISVPAVFDADGLYAISEQPEILRQAQGPVVITPHPGEMAQLLKISTEEVQRSRLEITTKAAEDWQVTVVLKGAKTIVAGPDGTVYINPTGNPGMATGGSGDVLTGVIAGLLGQGLEATKAAAIGVYLHGLAGDYGRQELGMAGLTAGDLLRFLPAVFKDFEDVR